MLMPILNSSDDKNQLYNSTATCNGETFLDLQNKAHIKAKYNLPEKYDELILLSMEKAGLKF